MQFAEAEPVRIADVESYKVKDLWLDLDVMSPVDFPGHYSIAVVLYDSLEPVLAAGNTARKVQSDFKVQTTSNCCSPAVLEQISFGNH